MSNSMPDAALIRRIAERRDAAALDALYDRHSGLVFSVAFGLLRDQSRAEQVTLDVFTRVWEKADSYKADRASVRTWLVSMARNRSIDVLRRANTAIERQSIPLGDVEYQLESTSHNPEQVVQALTEAERVRAALTTLPEDQLRVIQLAYYGGYTMRQIAEELDIPLGTVKTRVRLGMEKLRAILMDDQVDP